MRKVQVVAVSLSVALTVGVVAVLGVSFANARAVPTPPAVVAVDPVPVVTDAPTPADTVAPTVAPATPVAPAPAPPAAPVDNGGGLPAGSVPPNIPGTTAPDSTACASSTLVWNGSASVCA